MFHRRILIAAYCALGALAAVPGTTAAPHSLAASTAKSMQRAAQTGQTPFVWTDDEIDMLRENNVPISIVGGQTGAEPPMVPAAASELESYDKTKDPKWYAAQAAILRAELSARQATLNKQRDDLSEAHSERQTEPGVAMDRESTGVTPATGIEILQGNVQEVQDELDALADLARQNEIPPGVLRG